MSGRGGAALAGLLALVVTGSAHAAGLQINPVVADKDVFDPKQGEKVTVRFGLSAPADAALLVYDARDVLVRRVAAKERLPRGEHALVWDGRDDHGELVPSEAYHYVLQASGGSETVGYDLTDQTRIEAVIAKDVAWDPAKKVIRYLLPEASRVNVRIGLQDGGPLLRTLVNWLPREAGIREEPWDGMDESQVIDLSAHSKLSIVIHAIGFPDNTVVVGPPQSERTPYTAVEKPERRHVERPPGIVKRSFASQPVENLRDVRISLRLLRDLPRDADGVPLVSNPVPIEMDMPDRAERSRMLAERVETAFFVDGTYRYENESGVLPVTWTWDPAGTTPGDHYLTGNLLGIEGHFGTATLRVRVPASER